MNVKLKPLAEQVVLITGASSGIGRQSATRFAAAGSKVILVARSEEGLASAVAEIEASGGQVVSAVADVADVAALSAAAEAGVARFGRIDTWVNDAGVGLFTRLLDTDVADDRRLFETNFWGVVNGSRLAVPYLEAAGGGALINLGSVLSDVAIPGQGMYVASKHAIKGFTDALRQEVMNEGRPVSVTLIKPGPINTPYSRHAKNTLGRDGTFPPPVYDPNVVAEEILHAAVHGDREVFAGTGGWLMARIGQHAPGLWDWFQAKTGIESQLADRPADHSNEGLYASRGFHRAAGDTERDHHVSKVSLYNLARRNPGVTALAAVAVGVAAAGLIAGASKDD